jgi:formylglycine-generating enzyme required for sulfatase activity
VPHAAPYLTVSFLLALMAITVGAALAESAPPGPKFRDCPECPEMVTIPAGSFLMGSPPTEVGRNENEGPQHKVSVRRFAAGVYPVTRAEYAAFVRETRHPHDGGCLVWRTGKPADEKDAIFKDSSKDWSNPGFKQTDRDPAVCVSWEDAQAYVRWLNGKLCGSQKITTCPKEAGHYRLLTEAEWQYSARGGTTTPYYWGDRVTHDNANYGVEKCPPCGPKVQGKDLWDYTSPVGSFAPNPFGIFDLVGNAYQWVEDCWNDNYVGAPSDGSAWTTGKCKLRVSPGSDWMEDGSRLRVAFRDLGTTDERSQFTGLRVAKTCREKPTDLSGQIRLTFIC